LLLEAKAEPSAAKTDDGRTPLCAAAHTGHLNVVTKLLAARVDPAAETTNPPGFTALKITEAGGHTTITKHLASRAGGVVANAPDARREVETTGTGVGGGAAASTSGSPYTAQLAQLAEMRFTDLDANNLILEGYDGSLEQTLQTLMRNESDPAADAE
jgi:hypothetical protein